LETITVPITSAKTVGDSLGPNYWAAVFLAEIPDLGSYEVVDAIFYVYCYQLDTASLAPPYVITPVFVGPNATWNESTTDLSGTPMQSSSVGDPVIVDAVGWWEWNIYGDSSVGLKKILDDTGNNPGPITISFKQNYFHPWIAHENPKITSSFNPLMATVAHLSDTDDPDFAPYLEIIVSSTGDDPDKRKSYSSTAAAGG